MSDSLPPDTARGAKLAAAKIEPTRPHAPARRVRALECRVDGEGIAIPVDAVGQIVEYDVAPLPLARGAVRGLGLADGRLVVSLGIARASEGRRRTKAVLLRTADASGHWAFEVTEVRAFLEVEPPRGRATRALTADGRELAWIDAERLVADADALFVDGAAE